MEQEGNASHKLCLEQRKYLELAGVSDVISFDEKHILLETTMGMLEIRGNTLKVQKVRLDNGEFQIEGMVDSLQYSEVKNYRQKGKSFLKRAFR